MSTRTDTGAPRRTALPARQGPGALLAHGAAHGSLGELWQGPVPHGGVARIGLVTLPVPRHSYASYYAPEEGRADAGARAPLTAKRQAAVDLYLAYHRRVLPDGRWAFSSDLPVGKGMSSSTADILAVLRCLSSLLGTPEDPCVTREILRSIERSDAVHTDHYCLYLSGAHTVVRRYPSDVAFNVCYVYGACETRTDDYPEHHLLRRYAESSAAYASSLGRLDRALRARNTREIAREATRSVELAQRYLPSDIVDDLLRDHRALGGVGVVRAHTGTVAGLLSDEGFGAARRAELCAYFLARGYQCYFTRGGYPLV